MQLDCNDMSTTVTVTNKGDIKTIEIYKALDEKAESEAS